MRSLLKNHRYRVSILLEHGRLYPGHLPFPGDGHHPEVRVVLQEPDLSDLDSDLRKGMQNTTRVDVVDSDYTLLIADCQVLLFVVNSCTC